LVGNLEVKTSLGRPRCRWDDNIKVDKETGCHLSRDRDKWRALVHTLNEPYRAIELGKFLDELSDC
jgi:hypothetical protein